MKVYKADASGNTFHILIVDSPQEARQYLENLKRLGQWNFDSALVLLPSTIATFKMEVWEQDHTISNMCGNGARAVGTLLKKLHLPTIIEVGSGTLLDVEFDHRNNQAQALLGQVFQQGSIFVPALGITVPVYNACGEPHAVVLVPDVHRSNVERWGLSVVQQYHVNCTVVNLNGGREIYARTFERGVDHVTRSCGTGASSAVQFCIDHEHLLVGHNTTRVRMHNHMLAVHQEGQQLVLQGSVKLEEIHL